MNAGSPPSSLKGTHVEESREGTDNYGNSILTILITHTDNHTMADAEAPPTAADPVVSSRCVAVS